MGTPDFAVGTLKELIDNQYDVVAGGGGGGQAKGKKQGACIFTC